MGIKAAHTVSQQDFKACVRKRSNRQREPPSKGLCPRGYCSAKLMFESWPSAYANGYGVQVCLGSKQDALGERHRDNSYRPHKVNKQRSLKTWFNSEDWVNVCARDEHGHFKPCGRKHATLDHYPLCRPRHVPPGSHMRSAQSLTEAEIQSLCKEKQHFLPVKGHNSSMHIPTAGQSTARKHSRKLSRKQK